MIVRPSLAWNAAGNPGFFDPRWTFSRAGTATYMDPLGVMRTAPAGQPRWTNSPVTGIPQGLLIENSATNLALYSRALSDAAWTKTSMTVTADQAVALDGTTVLDLLAVTGASGRASQSVTITAGHGVTWSAYCRANATNFALLEITDGTNRVYAWFNLATGAVGTTNAGSSFVTLDEARIEPMGGGLYRCVLSAFTNTINSITVRIAPTSADNTSAANTDSMFAGDVQIEASVAAEASSFIPTTSATVTRPADALNIATDTRWFNAAEGTLVFEWCNRATRGSGWVMGGFAQADGTTNNTLYITRPSFTQLQLVITSGGVNSVNSTETYNFTVGTIGRLAVAYAANDVAWTIDGGTVRTDNSAVMPLSPDRMALGGSPYFTTPTAQCGMGIRRFGYFPRRLANADLQSLTAIPAAA